MRVLKTAVTCVAVMAAMAGQSWADIMVHTTDFIVDGNRTHFNGFEAMPGITWDGAVPYVEDSIRVQQINGDSVPYDIYTLDSFAGQEGDHAWYPNGGDYGYTQLTMADGSGFQDIGFLYGAYGSASNILFELLQNGSVVKSGSTTLIEGANYLGFSGGGFDTVRVRAGTGSVTDGALQYLWIDSIETQVPEPGSIAALLSLAGCGVGALVLRRRRAKKLAA